MSTDFPCAPSYPSQRVVVLRHGERRDNAPNAPVESNPPLTEAGVAAVKAVAARLIHLLGNDAARSAVLVVSPFLRTLQTAEALQHHGVGAAQAMVIDNTMCEVFGPSRINTSRAPQLQAPPMKIVVGRLPLWGESIEMATERYVANFLRIGDVYGGYLAGSSHLTGGFISSGDQPPTSATLVQEAVTIRNPSRLPPRKVISRGLTGFEGSISTNLRDRPSRDVVLVTHGDAISAVVSHFYPARLVYEADFLSFVIMRRFGVGNHVYHLDKSAGVSWLVEGTDLEPNDPIMLSLERQHLVTEGTSGTGQDNSVKDRRDSLREEGDDVDDDSADVPVSLVSRRMQSCGARGTADYPCVNSRLSSLPQNPVAAVRPRLAAIRCAPTTNGRSTRAVAGHDDLGATSSLPPTQARGNRRRHHEHGRPSSALPYQTRNDFPTAGNAPAPAPAPAAVAPAPPQTYPEYEKPGEGPEGICFPTGAPAQCSRHGITMINKGRNSGEAEEEPAESTEGWRCSRATPVCRGIERGREARRAR
ncbi:hypothetical protein JKF63_01320 [Porcisia hertigi]|uniref:Phosphoglycerate mutase n=1 Tax=Porcisia hertigi TaxID=2761500 RepID=A0A836L378_9TRYP|nr:hypothetical protein JKF63_01320 [Porcisia hertigi]